MNVKQLKEQLAGIPDEALVVIPAHDHSYALASVDSTKALAFYEKRSITLAEDCGQEPGINSHPVKVPVLVFS